MAVEHSLLRTAIESLEEAVRLLSRYEKRDINFKFTNDNLHSLRGAASMANQGARAIAECNGYVAAIIERK